MLGIEPVDCGALDLRALIPEFPVHPNVVFQERVPIVSEFVAPGGDGTRILEIVADSTTYGGRQDGVASAGDVRRVFAYSLRDITARKSIERAEREAKHAAIAAGKAKDHLIAAISHELRTPLNAIIGFSQLLSEEKFGPLGNDNYKIFAADVHKGGQHLLALINDMLQVAKLEAGDIAVETEEFELGTLIESCTSEFATDIAGGRKSIRTPCPGT